MGSERLVWPDAAKGLCMLLVVLLHVTNKSLSQLAGQDSIVWVTWAGINSAVAPMRMPLFFYISGMFASSSLRRPWAAVRRRRLLGPYYLYAVWYVIHAAFFSWFSPIDTNIPNSVAEFFLGFVLGYTSLWYLFALPFYFVVAFIFQRWRFVATITALILSFFAASNLLSTIGNSSSLAANLVFFLLAAYFPNSAIRFRPNRTFLLFASLLIFLGAAGALAVTGLDRVGVLWVALSFYGCFTGVAVFVWLSETIFPVVRPLSYVGRQTLAVYVLHLPLLSLFHHLLLGALLPVLILAILPAVATVVLTALSITIKNGLQRLRLDFLFSPPSSLSSR